jgi:hypothetical protein
MEERVQTASVDLRRGELIVQGWNRTIAGFWIANEHWARVPNDVDDVALGRAVEDMLVVTEWDVPVPERDTWRPPIYAALGVRTHGQYARGVREVSVERRTNEIAVQSYRNAGRDGFVPYPDDRVVLEATTQPGSLGATVRAALQRALP